MQASQLSLIANAAWVVKGGLKPLSKLHFTILLRVLKIL